MAQTSEQGRLNATTVATQVAPMLAIAWVALTVQIAAVALVA